MQVEREKLDKEQEMIELRLQESHLQLEVEKTETTIASTN